MVTKRSVSASFTAWGLGVGLALVASCVAAGDDNVAGSQQNTEGAYAGAFVTGCPPVFMNVTPTAKQCCYSQDRSGRETTYHVGVQTVTENGPTQSPTQAQTNVSKVRNPFHAACRAPDGIGASCSGQWSSTNPNGCLYGPNEFASPQTTPPPATPPGQGAYLGVTMTFEVTCFGAHSQTPPGPFFADVTGTFALGQGCCNGKITSPTQLCCKDVIVNGPTCPFYLGQSPPDTSGHGLWDY